MIVFDNLSYTYPDAAHPVLKDVSLTLPESAFILVVGPSGAGKSTLLRCLNGLVPHFSGGVMQGQVRIGNLDPVVASPSLMSRYVGFVFQDPEAQFVMDRVEDEIAFALENAALPRQEMRARVAEVLELLELEALRDRRLDTLSGGEKQRVAIAAALALQPQVLALDEPTSQLDPQSAEEVLRALTRLNTDLGITVVLVEHRLARVLPFADQVVYLPGRGLPVRAGTPEAVLPYVVGVPPVVELGRALDWSPLPLTVEAACPFVQKSLPASGGGTCGGEDKLIKEGSIEPHPLTPCPDFGEGKLPSASGIKRIKGGTPYITLENVSVTYGDHPALQDVNLALYPGEIVALLGRNGAGKTTLLRCITGLIRPRQGQVRVAGKNIKGADCASPLDVAEICRQVGYLPQDPNALLFADSVLDELRITLRNHNIAEAEAPVSPAALLARLGLSHKARAYPRDLSVGERQRVALGAIMVTRPGALLLDEPTRGLDYAAKQRLLEILLAWRNEGMAVLLVTHDVELVAALADRVIVLEEGGVAVQGEPASVMRAMPAFTPQIARLFPGSDWLTVGDVLEGLGFRSILHSLL